MTNTGHIIKELLDTSIQDLMSDQVTTLSPDDTLGFTLLHMIQKRFRRFPVVDENDKLVGIVTSTDLLRRIDRAKSIAVLEQELATIVTKSVVAVDKSASFNDALQSMVNHKISCLPIEDKDGKLCGIFTNKDLLLFNVLWRELPEVEIDIEDPHLLQYEESLQIKENDSIAHAIEVMIHANSKELILQNDHNEDIGIITVQRILRSIATNLMTEGFSMDYLHKSVVSRVVAEPIIDEELPTTLEIARRHLNKRGIESLLLKKDNKYKAIINEAIAAKWLHEILNGK